MNVFGLLSSMGIFFIIVLLVVDIIKKESRNVKTSIVMLVFGVIVLALNIIDLFIWNKSL